MYRFTFLLLFSMLLSAVPADAQTYKYGHINLGNLLEELPQTAEAEAKLRIIADSLNRRDSLMTAAFQAAYLKLKKEYDEGMLTPIQVQQRQSELEKQRDEIQNFEEEAQRLIEAKRAELLEPIVKRVNEAIQAVAKREGYAMIFDIGSGALLFAIETIDITALVRKELGLQ
ncbi:MAG: OmpH family outer membrane protein [Saprospiraceae bacterium]|nr:OmpH family outer membrane protein [Saprospiraceae bacterium]MDW8229007.1 OmpH family outer membrane protein [Saprospiraceae bacterium]